jgi:hypothetical protein
MDTREALRLAWQRAKEMPAEKRFTVLDLLGNDIPSPFWHSIQGMLREKHHEGATRGTGADEQPLIQGKSIDSGDPRIGNVISFLWAAED